MEGGLPLQSSLQCRPAIDCRDKNIWVLICSLLNQTYFSIDMQRTHYFDKENILPMVYVSNPSSSMVGFVKVSFVSILAAKEVKNTSLISLLA